MLYPNNFLDTTELQSEQALNLMIEAGHRTIDWSVSLYFKTLKKSHQLFLDKLLSSDQLDFCQGFYTYLLNETELAQLIKDIEEHVNNEIISVQNKWAPHVKFQTKTKPLEIDFISQFFNEQRTTLKLSKQVDQIICKMTSQNLAKLAPAFMPKPLVAKTNCSLARSIAQTIGVDTNGHRQQSKEMLAKLLNGILTNVERELKEWLKYQLAEQLYQWHDHFAVPNTNELEIIG